MTRKTDQPGSLNRAEALIRAIACGPAHGSSLNELLKQTGLPRPTVYRVLEQLGVLGWIERDEQTSLFNFGPQLSALGYTAMARLPLERVAATNLSAAAARLKQIVYLDVRAGLICCASAAMRARRMFKSAADGLVCVDRWG